MNKVYKKRDSGVATLRKLGVPKADYEQFISVDTNGMIVVNLTAAMDHVNILKQQGGTAPVAKPAATKERKVKKQKPASKKEKTPKQKPAVKAPKTASISMAVLELCKSGKDNAEVWAKIKEKFNLPDTKKWYASWYRSHHVRNGNL